MVITKSIEYYNEALNLLPGGVNSPVRAFKAVGGTPIFVSHGDGGYIIDVDNNRYIDFVQSWGPLIFGHCDKDIEEAVIKTVKGGLSFGAPTKLESELAHEIIEIYNGVIEKIRFVSSGTEAVMSAIRLARGYTNRDDIVKFEGCYHGHSDSLLVQAGSGAITFGNPSSPGVPSDFTKHTLLARYNDIESVKKCFKESSNIACVIIEPIAGNMGLVKSDEEFLIELKRLCYENGALLIFDEVMSGFRAALNGACGVYRVKPDIVTFGKVIGAGMPVGAFGASKEIMSKMSPEGPIYQAGTLSGNPVAMSAGVASVKKIKSNKELYKELHTKASRLVTGLKEEADNYGIPLQIDSIGSMFGFFFNSHVVKNFDDAKKSDLKFFAHFHQEMLKRGVYLACSQFEVGFVSTQTTDEMIDFTIDCAKEIFKAS